MGNEHFTGIRMRFSQSQEFSDAMLRLGRVVHGAAGQDVIDEAVAIPTSWLRAFLVMVHDDIDIGIGDDSTFKDVLAMSPAQAQGEPLISRVAALEEAKRRGILASTYDAEEDAKLIDEPPEPPMPPPFPFPPQPEPDDEE